MSRFSGFPAHIEHHIGRVRGADSRDATGPDGTRDRGYHLVHCDHDDGNHVSMLTSGLREHLAGAPLPQELVCTAHVDQALSARHLVAVVAELLVGTRSRIGYGALVMNDRTLLPDTDIAGALAGPHPYLADTFDVLLHGGEPALQLITLIPITRPESQLVARAGTDALYDQWEHRDVDLTDLTRRA